jgi:arginase family enzyme
LRLRILDIDGSLPAQPGIAAAIGDGRAQRVDLRNEERSLRLWASRRQLRALAARLTALTPPPGQGPLVTFYGSGDYHHLATMLIASVAEPVTVVHFDNHADWVRVPATHNCGGWVNRALALQQVKRVITLGICSDDLVRPQLKSGNVAALASGRLEIHAWRAPPSRVWGRIGDGPGHSRIGRHIVWNCLAELNWPDFLDALAARLPTEAVWVTIDKDVLRLADAATNWDQGGMPLDALLTALKRLAATRRIVGVDICGEYSPPRFFNPIKRIAAWLDHPRALPARPEALARNDRTNRALIETLGEILR